MVTNFANLNFWVPILSILKPSFFLIATIAVIAAIFGKKKCYGNIWKFFSSGRSDLSDNDI